MVLLAPVAGFLWFLRATGAEPPPAPSADGIVVLTGGADRVETGLRLLADGRGRVLLVSGVGGAADFGLLARRAGVDPGLAARVTLGRAAASTRGNAAETADWVRAHDIRSLIVVTAAYHMPRAILELSRALPDVTLHPAPALLRSAPPLRLLASEYVKWLVSEFGLSRYASRPEATARDMRDRHPGDSAEAAMRIGG